MIYYLIIVQQQKKQKQPFKKVTSSTWPHLRAFIEFIRHSIKLRNSVPLEWQFQCLRNFKNILESVSFL